MATDSQRIVSIAWNIAQILQDDGLSYMAFTEQSTFLFLLKMADEQSQPPYNRPAIVPARYNWGSLPMRFARSNRLRVDEFGSGRSRGRWAGEHVE